tara:strand:+ start:122 stop:922 length:801 start_codon:yes stop_codon:yes gene_type:complete
MKNKLLYIFICALTFIVAGNGYAQTEPKVFSAGELRITEIGRGEELPVEIQLVNFGTPNERVDATLVYSITYKENGAELFRTTETVAVETTASFNRDIIIPNDFPYGDYSISVDVRYQGQIFPALSESGFVVVRKAFGYPITHWINALLILLVIVLLVIFLQKSIFTQKHGPTTYTHVSEDERIYYEIIHGIIHELHYHVGDDAIKRISKNIPGLRMSDDGEHVLEISAPIVDIIPVLMQKYHEISGKHLNVILDHHYSDKRVSSH